MELLHLTTRFSQRMNLLTAFVFRYRDGKEDRSTVLLIGYWYIVVQRRVLNWPISALASTLLK